MKNIITLWEDYDIDLQNKFYWWFWMGGEK